MRPDSISDKDESPLCITTCRDARRFEVRPCFPLKLRPIYAVAHHKTHQVAVLADDMSGMKAEGLVVAAAVDRGVGIALFGGAERFETVAGELGGDILGGFLI